VLFFPFSFGARAGSFLIGGDQDFFFFFSTLSFFVAIFSREESLLKPAQYYPFPFLISCCLKKAPRSLARVPDVLRAPSPPLPVPPRPSFTPLLPSSPRLSLFSVFGPQSLVVSIVSRFNLTDFCLPYFFADQVAMHRARRTSPFNSGLLCPRWGFSFPGSRIFTITQHVKSGLSFFC